MQDIKMSTKLPQNSGVEFYLAKLLIRRRKFRNRIRVPTVYDQPYKLLPFESMQKRYKV